MPKKINWASKLKTYCFAKVDKEMFLLASLDLEVDKKKPLNYTCKNCP